MICHELMHTSLSEVRINFDRYTYLHPEGQRLISGWFERAWAKRDCQGDDCFEAFIFAWIALNGWAACIPERDEESQYLDALKRDRTLCQDFKRLVAIPESPVAFHAVQFAAQWPIFEVKSLRRRRIIMAHEPNRRTVIKRSFAAGATAFAPKCWKRHADNREQIPVDWPPSHEPRSSPLASGRGFFSAHTPAPRDGCIPGREKASAASTHCSLPSTRTRRPEAAMLSPGPLQILCLFAPILLLHYLLPSSNAKTSEHHRTPRKEQLLPSLWKYQTGWVNKLLLVQHPYKMGVPEQER